MKLFKMTFKSDWIQLSSENHAGNWSKFDVEPDGYCPNFLLLYVTHVTFVFTFICQSFFLDDIRGVS